VVFFREEKVRMNKMTIYFNRVKIGLAMALSAALSGCVGDAEVGYTDVGYGGVVVAPAPNAYIYGDFYDRGRDVHAFGARGFASRGIAHPGGRGRVERR
jgi:hypothetical protein